MFTGKLAVLMNPFTSVHKNLKVVKGPFLGRKAFQHRKGAA